MAKRWFCAKTLLRNVVIIEPYFSFLSISIQLALENLQAVDQNTYMKIRLFDMQRLTWFDDARVFVQF